MSARAILVLIASTSAFVLASNVARAQSASAPAPALAASCRGEADCLRKFPGLVTRRGDVLMLKLGNGRTKTFRDESKACERQDIDKCISYHLLAHHPTHRSFVIEGRYHEGQRTILVSSHTGHATKLIEEPHYSPSGKRLAAVAGCDSFCESGIDIWSATDPPKLEWRYRLKDEYQYKFVRWNGDDRLQMRLSLWLGKELHESLSIEAVRTPEGWKLTSPVLTEGQ